MTTCIHIDQIRDASPQANGCVGCLESGDSWLHLRLCMSGYVGCCDSSPTSMRRHTLRRPIIRSWNCSNRERTGSGATSTRVHFSWTTHLA